MSTGWWLVLGVVVLFALVAAYVDGTGRLRRRGLDRRDGSRSGSRTGPPDGSRDEPREG